MGWDGKLNWGGELVPRGWVMGRWNWGGGKSMNEEYSFIHSFQNQNQRTRTRILLSATSVSFFCTFFRFLHPADKTKRVHPGWDRSIDRSKKKKKRRRKKKKRREETRGNMRRESISRGIWIRKGIETMVWVGLVYSIYSVSMNRKYDLA